MAPRPSARWLAPLALVATVLALVLVVGTSVSSSPAGESSTASDVSAVAPARPRAARSRPAPRRARTYVVRPGDTLSEVASRTGVPLARIRRLNPGLNANALHTGQRIRLSVGTP